MNNYHAGDVVAIDLGIPPDAIKGHEQAKQRPCVVVQSYENIGLLIIIPVTSKKPKVPLFTVVELTKGAGGLSQNSYALCHQIRSVAVERIKNKLGRLSDRDFRKIQSVLLDTLNL